MRILLAAMFLVGSFGLATEAWIEKSNENAQLFLNAMASFAPEGIGEFGVDGLDEEIMDLNPDLLNRSMAAIEKVTATLKDRLKEEKNPWVRQDIEILLTTVQLEIDGAKLEHEHNYDWTKLSEVIFTGIRALLDDQVAPERRQAALVRLRKYAGLETGYKPATEKARHLSEESLKRAGLLWPVKGELEQYLGTSPRYIEGIEQLFAKYEIKGYEEPLAALKKQLTDYDNWLRDTYLPNARTDFRQPLALYRNSLAQRGITIEPDELINRAQIAFMEITQEMKVIAQLVAREKGMKSEDYRDVIRELKKDQFKGEAILPHYRERNRQLEELIRKHHIVSLPERELAIRLASEAESARTPAPNMQPPRMLGNTGELGQFVLPLNVPSPDGKTNLQFDDFCFAAASWTLSVHEGRPGHELQFASVVEKGVSTARIMTFNSVNAEGWALYMEAVMKPYMPLEGQLISLQHRLLRAARAFLDPQLQLGRITPEEAHALLMDRVVLSEAMANQEVERYTYWAPGQAPSYFFGYSNLMAIRSELELVLGDDLNLKDFHDFILNQGLLPHNLLRKAIMEEFVPKAKARKTNASGH